MKKLGSLFVILLASCSDPKTASDANFKVAIQSYLDTAWPRCYVSLSFPHRKIDLGAKVEDIDKLLAGLVAAGYVTVTEAPSSLGRKNKPDQIFTLTDEGKKQSKAKSDSFSANNAHLCVGKATVVDVKNFTEPSDLFGMRISNVTYTYKVVDIPAWTKTLDEIAFMNRLRKDRESSVTPVTDSAGLILTNKGWVHEKLFKN